MWNFRQLTTCISWYAPIAVPTKPKISPSARAARAPTHTADQFTGQFTISHRCTTRDSSITFLLSPVYAASRRSLGNPRSSPAAGDEADDQHHHAYHEEDPGDLRGNLRHAEQAEEPRDEADHEKDERVIEHWLCPPRDRKRATLVPAAQVLER